MAANAAKDTCVRIGDIVTLKFLKNMSFLSSEGILVEDVFVSTSLRFFEEHQFQIYIQRQYSATNELEEFIDINGTADAADLGTANHQAALLKGKENESVLNRSVMKGKTGNVLCFGDTIQLLHVKSKKYITVRPKVLARDERENLKVTLSKDGSVLSWIKVLPRFKINKEGEPIKNGADVLLKISERSNEFLHCAERTPRRGKHREVNSSLEAPTPWKLSIFQKRSDVESVTQLLAGELIYIRDPETGSMLAPIIRPMVVDHHHHHHHLHHTHSAVTPGGNLSKAATSKLGTPYDLTSWASESQTGFGTSFMESQDGLTTGVMGESSLLQMNNAETEDEGALSESEGSDSDTASLNSLDEFLLDHGDVALQPMSEDPDTNSLWMVEHRSLVKGGPVKHRSELVHLRHFNSGRYLTIKVKKNDEKSFVLTLQSEATDSDLFALQPLHTSSDVLLNASAVQLKHDHFGQFIERGHYRDGQRVYTCNTTRVKSRGVNVIVTRYQQKSTKSLVKSTFNPDEEILDIYFGHAVMHHLRRYVLSTYLPETPTTDVNTIWPRIESVDRSLFFEVVLAAAFFVKGYPFGTHVFSSSDLAKVKTERYVIERRQHMMRQQGLVQDVMSILQSLSPLVNWLTSDVKLMRGGVVEVGQEVLGDCLHLLFDLIQKNITSQLYIADHLLVVLAHVSTDRMAAKVAQELLSSNRELQETKIGQREITIFAEKMREVSMNSMYVQLLRTCCSCSGLGVPKNQEIVNTVVFEQYKDILIDILESYDKTYTCDWSQHATNNAALDLYVTPYLKENRIRGASLYTRGIPSISLKWSSKSSRFQMMKLFSRSPVPLSDLFRPNLGGPNLKRRSATGRTLKESEIKSVIGEFFVAEMNLVADLCLGRNYPVMKKMEKFCSFEVLVTILQTSHFDSLKDAAAALLLNLYVDKDPQTMVVLPRLTRTLTEMVKASPGSLYCVEGGRVCEFGLVQLMISHHLDTIKGKKFASHSLSMMKLLHKLVSFGYYGQADKMRETIALLAACLSRGTSDLEKGDQTNPMMYSSLKKLQSKRSISTNGTGDRVNVVGHGGGGAVSSSLPNSRQPSANSRMSFGSFGRAVSFSALSEGDGESRKSSYAASISFRLPPEASENVLHSLESVRSHMMMVVFVLLSIGVSIYQEVSGNENFGFFIFDWAVLGVFVIEMLVHFIFHMVVVKKFFKFFHWLRWLEVACVAIYAIVYALIPGYPEAKFMKCLLMCRCLLMYKVYRDNQIAEEERALALKNSAIVWLEPERYHLTPATTLTTIEKIVQILCTLQHSIEDRKLSMLLKAFYDWIKDPADNPSKMESLFTGVIEATSDLHISNDYYDNLYIDLLMYSSPALVQTSLELLMIHHSSTRILLDNVSKLQLITSGAGEHQFARMESIIVVLKSHTDTHEIWGKLLTAEHRETSDTMMRSLNELMEDCRKKREVLCFDEVYEPVKSSQNILRNLGCVDLCLKVVQLIASIDVNDSFADCHVNTRNLALAANHLLYWLILNNPANQALAFAHLKYFIKIIDAKVDVHKVIGAMFHNNLDLMESVPKTYISDMADLICHTGRFPQYLTLMRSIIAVGDKNVIANQHEVIKRLCSPENLKKVVLFFVPVNHPDYASKKIKLMKTFMNVKDVTVDTLPSDLAYHLDLLDLFSSCTIGRSGMTTIEAKVQSLFSFVDIIEAMLDPSCLLLAKIRYGLFLFNAIIDVETQVPALKDAECIWRLLVSTQDVFAFAKDDLRQIEKNGWQAATSNRQKVEYMVVCAMIVKSYFSESYDHTIFKPEVGQTALGVERVTIKEHQAQEIIRSLFLKICGLYEMLSPLLAEDHHQLLFDCLCVLNEKAKEKIVLNVENIHDSYFRSLKDYGESNRLGDDNSKLFDEFVIQLNKNENIKKLADDQVQGFIAKLESIPRKKDLGDSDIRFEALIEKIVTHIRHSVEFLSHGDELLKFVTPEATKTGIWLIRVFRTMIENRWGMSIYERDDDGGEEQDDSVVDLMKVYNDSGVTEMCLDLISKGIDITLQSEALKLLVGMLFKEGGALDIQKSIYAHLSKPGSDMFFLNVRSILHNLISWHQWNSDVEEDQELPEEFILVRCLQLTCEGHYGPNQDLMREQPNNNVSVNLLDTFVTYLQALAHIKKATSTAAEGGVMATVLEVIQGPCTGNQDYFALNTELIETLNRKLRQQPEKGLENEELELKKNCMDIFQALLEGQGRKTAVYERMLSVIHIDVILVLCKGSNPMIGGGGGGDEGEEEESDEAVDLKTESLVLMQMLSDFRPSLKEEDGFDEINNDTSVACIELVWRGELQRRFFHVPDICASLAKSTKDKFVMYVKRASPEDKLYGLLEGAREMYREILHQQLLKSYKLDLLFSRTNLDYSTWTSFYVVLAINVLFVIFYHAVEVPCHEYHDDGAIAYAAVYYTAQGESFEVNDTKCSAVRMDADAALAIMALNYLLIVVSFFSVVCYIVVKIPLNYRQYMDSNMEKWRAVLYTALDVNTFYYATYFVMALVGLIYHATLTFLLLDFISKNPTSQGVLRAVYNPRKQIFMTCVLTFILLYIFAMYEFYFLNDVEDFTSLQNVISLNNTFKFLLRWGLPYGSPENYMVLTISTYRVISDIMFFIVTMLMLNILKGITIDTFVELRKQLEERIKDTEEKCFMCGIEKNTFNRTLDRDAFRSHIKTDQNLWNYIYFIIFIWEQDKDDDDGLESYVRRCVQDGELVWFPMNKAIKLAEHNEKGDVTSLKYRFRKDLQRTESLLQDKMTFFKDQLNRTIGRVEKSLEYGDDPAAEMKRTRASRTRSRMHTSSFERHGSGSQQSSVMGGGAGGGSPPGGGPRAKNSSHNQSFNSFDDFVSEESSQASAAPRSKPATPSVPSTPVAGSRPGTTASVSAKSNNSSSKNVLDRGAFAGESPATAAVMASAATGAPLTPNASTGNTPRNLAHPANPAASMSRFNAMEADNMCQMHMRLVSINGMNIRKEHLPFISVRIISDFANEFIRPLANVESKLLLRKDNYTSSTPAPITGSTGSGRPSTADRKPLEASAAMSMRHSFHVDQGSDLELGILRFDLLFNPLVLVHEGPLPQTDLHNVNVKIQVLYQKDDERVFLAGVYLPFVSLVEKAAAGAHLEVTFNQRPYEIEGGVNLKVSDYNEDSDDEEGGMESTKISVKTVVPATQGCKVVVSAIASHKLLKDWSMVNK